ncbi:hypothetical protein MAR_035448 [Mya arenaria]|uniref:Uncharacterized protein n=1 Tax=Mya arenaria TaxID=6604 RepID=A0ABY7EK51_MYAAR|nr:hypothetical protein MAR_035448 [Mya arenaria]
MNKAVTRVMSPEHSLESCRESTSSSTFRKAPMTTEITEAHPGSSANDWAIAEGHLNETCWDIPMNVLKELKLLEVKDVR